MEKHLYHVGKDNEEGYVMITVTPKSYWLKNECVSDKETRRDIVDFLEENGFEEACDSTFVGEMLTIEQTNDLLELSDLFESNEEFTKFLKHCLRD